MWRKRKRSHGGNLKNCIEIDKYQIIYTQQKGKHKNNQLIKRKIMIQSIKIIES